MVDLLRDFPEVGTHLDLCAALGLSEDAYWALPEDERALRMAHYVKGKRKCPHCGGDPEECSDSERVWYPQRTICYSTMQAAAARWKYQQIHDEKQFHDGTFRWWSDKRSDSFPFARDDGVTIWVAPMDLTPDDDFLRQRSARGLDAESNSPSDQHHEPR